MPVGPPDMARFTSCDIVMLYCTKSPGEETGMSVSTNFQGGSLNRLFQRYSLL